jgi:hypothetical protein
MHTIAVTIASDFNAATASFFLNRIKIFTYLVQKALQLAV